MRRAALVPLGEKRKCSTAAIAEGGEADTDHISVEKKEKKQMNTRQLFEKRMELKVRELDVRQQSWRYKYNAWQWSSRGLRKMPKKEKC